VSAAAPLTLAALTVAGAAYLMYLGVRVLRSPATVDHPGAPGSPATSQLHFLVRGIGVSALNPKGLLVFLSILPQFARPAASWPLPAQLAVLGGVYILICAAFYLPLGHTAARVLGARPGVARATTRVAGASMVLVGLALLAERLMQAI
jgi:threonine/homoserine/homoserine lactone efflux protein